METLFDISLQITEPEYRALPAYSYSTISRYYREGFSKVSSLFDKQSTPSLVFGSMVDALITGGQKEFDDSFFVATFPNLSDALKSVVISLFESNKDTCSSLSEVSDNAVLAAAEVHKLYTSWKDQTRINKIKELGSQYYKLLFICGDRLIISSDDYEDCLKCVNALKTSPATRNFFSNNNPFTSVVEKFYQLKFAGHYNNIPLRAMSDLIMVNHEKKEIILCDLKTSFKPEYEFYKSFIEWNYFWQAQIYYYVIRQNLDKHPIYKDYKLSDCVFIVVSRNTRTPLTWFYSDTKDDVFVKEGKTMSWKKTLCELNDVLTKRPKLPVGIMEDKPNDIMKWINESN